VGQTFPSADQDANDQFRTESGTTSAMSCFRSAPRAAVRCRHVKTGQSDPKWTVAAVVGDDPRCPTAGHLSFSECNPNPTSGPVEDSWVHGAVQCAKGSASLLYRREELHSPERPREKSVADQAMPVSRRWRGSPSSTHDIMADMAEVGVSTNSKSCRELCKVAPRRSPSPFLSARHLRASRYGWA
jgi:hypothetical protein